MSTSDAWLLECGDALSIAVGDHEMVELLQRESCQEVPGTPSYCSKVLVWNESIVPVMDIAGLHENASGPKSDAYFCLLYFQSAPNSPLQLVAIRVEHAPERIRVDDAQLCEIPTDFDDSLLKPVTLSCFTHHARPVLVLDISSLCSDGFRNRASADPATH